MEQSKITNPGVLAIVAGLLGVSGDTLGEAIVNKTQVIIYGLRNAN